MNRNLNPFIKAPRNTTPIIMLDVIIALLPIVVVSGIAFGIKALLLIGISVLSAALTDFVFSDLLLKKAKSVFDGSSIVTGLLIALIVSPLTPGYVLAIGASSGVLAGKILWGGLGKNLFNPALVGREVMTAIFPAVMGASGIWATKSYINIPAEQFFPGLESHYLNSYLSSMIYKTNGALGEYSSLLIITGGLYLLIRRRISWHIPTALLTVFFACFWFVNEGDDLKYSVAGILFGTIFMATDMPSSPNNNNGKLYYGAMIGLVTFILIWGGIRFEYLSYSILILNGFSIRISEIFKPRVWGMKTDWYKKAEQIFMLTLSIFGVTLAVLSLHKYNLQSILLYIFIGYIILKYSFSYRKGIKEEYRNI